MTTEEYAIGYEEGHQAGWNSAMDSLPPQRTWVGLTKKEFQESVEGLEDLEDCWVAIEAKLKQKNGYAEE